MVGEMNGALNSHDVAMAFSVPDLPYPHDALEPHISAETMRFHHDKHHQAYVDKANAALDGTQWADTRAEDLLAALDELPEDLRDRVRDNVGGHVNHTMFWASMKPDGGGQPGGKLLGAIKGAFGNFKVFKDTVRAASMSVFGSGWAWLVDDGTRVFIVTTTNQDSPLSDGLTPLVGIDVWEHAYYLQYENRRAEYVDAWLSVVDWEAVEARYEAVPRQDVSDILSRGVSIAGVETVFGEIDIDAARTQAAELKALQGWGPMAKVGSIARAWNELAQTLDKRGAATVADLDASTIISSATDLWVIPPGRSMV
ncbi:MAG: superoxide dismutase, Fe-Mn family [Frankiaceae bacterium]|nr:superoxide dismutase, Fe-Mn family [Frankiaceae bacterium]